MTPTNIINGIKNAEMLADYFNSIILESGQVKPDNRKIWQGLLHKPEIDNEFFGDTLAGLEMLLEHAPEAWQRHNKEQFWDARRAFNEYRDRHPRVLDTVQDGKSLKGYAWKICMTCREVVNAVNGIDIPNKDQVAV